jgi:hypothetical protein
MSAITVAQFRTAVWSFISSQVIPLVPNAQVIWMEQGSPRPKLSYIGLKIIVGPHTYGDDDMRQSSPGVYSIEGQRSFTVSVNIFGNNSEEIAALITNAMSKPSALEALAASSIALLNSTDQQNVSVPLETKFENRIQFDITFGCVMAATDNVGFIEQTGILDNRSEDQTEIG